jgi:hypothetical protein
MSCRLEWYSDTMLERATRQKGVNALTSIPSKMKLISIVPLLFVAISLPFTPARSAKPNETVTAAETAATVRVAPSAVDLRNVKNDPAQIAAEKILESQNEQADYRSASKFVNKTIPNEFAIVFNVTDKSSKKPGEYSKLVYQKEASGKTFVYFDEKTAGYRRPSIPTSSPPPSLAIAPCFGKQWGPWTYDYNVSDCRPRILCLGKKRQGTFTQGKRTKNCRNGVVETQTCWVFNSCGC